MYDITFILLGGYYLRELNLTIEPRATIAKNVFFGINFGKGPRDHHGNNIIISGF